MIVPLTEDDSRDSNDLRTVLQTLRSATSTSVLILESTDGAIGDLDDLVPTEWGAVARAAGAETTRGRVGGIAEDLGLEDLESGVIVIENAQWVDPTSLGRLQRLVKDPDRTLLIILAHRPLSGLDGWGIERLEEAAGRHAVVHKVRVESADGAPWPLPEELAGTDLLIGAGLAGQSISVPVCARLLGVSESEALAIAEHLVERGLLRETRTGFSSVRQFDVGEARVGYVAARLAAAMQELGGTSEVLGNLRLAAGDPARAFSHLASAAFEAEEHRALAEAAHLAETALVAAEAADVGDEDQLGRLHLVCARFLRAAGRAEWAALHLDRAAAMLEGPERIDALGFAAAVADDRQHPQEAETILATAEWEATRQGETGKLGSLCAFRARELHRIGFTPEADAMLDRSAALLELESTPMQRFYAGGDRAWISFDRGEVARAEMEFTLLRDEAGRLEGDASVADKEAWRARALFASGRPGEALAAVAVAREMAERAEVEAPLFLADLALAEGRLAHGCYDEALEAADRVLDLVERQLPGWENVARCNRAATLLRMGRVEEAGHEIAAALSATPAGSNGWRWRTRCRALQLEIDAVAGQAWQREEAEDLADHMLQSHLYGWAAELLCVIAENGKRKDVAREALALAVQIGNPMLGARAAAAGKLWGEPAAAPVIVSLRAMVDRLPPGWEDDWNDLDQVREGLAAPEPRDDNLRHEQAEILEKAMRRAGLSGVDVVLSPAQRRSRGLARRRRVIRPLQLAAAVLAVVVVAGGTAVAVAQMRPEPSPGTVVVEVAAPTTAPPPSALEETEIPIPDGVQQFSGTAGYRGDPGRTGFIASEGVQSVNGYYWRVPVVGLVQASPVAYGNNLLIGTTDGVFYALDQTSGQTHWSMTNLGRISAAPALGATDLGEGRTAALVVIASEDGHLRARDSVMDTTNLLWDEVYGDRIVSAPAVADDRVVVANSDGFVFGVNINDGSMIWEYPGPPGEVDGLGAVSAAVTVADGIAYVGTEQGELHLIDIETGSQICSIAAAGPIVANPIVSDGVVYVPTQSQTIHVLPAGECQGSVPDRFPFLGYTTETPTVLAPAVVGDVLYLPERRFLYAQDLRDWSDVWPPSTVQTERPISTPPVVDDGTVYFGAEDGYVYAVDAETGEERWRWNTGTFVRAAPVVVNGAVFVVSGDGIVYAIGP